MRFAGTLRIDADSHNGKSLCPRGATSDRKRAGGAAVERVQLVQLATSCFE